MTRGVYTASETPEDSGVIIYHRVVGPDHDDSTTDLVVAADITSVAIKVIKKSDGSTVTTAAPTASTVFPATTTTLGGVEYNFKYATTTAMLPDGDQVYRFEILITPVSGAAYYLTPVDIPTIAMST